jgi:hypothetical protein
MGVSREEIENGPKSEKNKTETVKGKGEGW